MTARSATLGIDVGPIGRWTRLALGLALLLLAALLAARAVAGAFGPVLPFVAWAAGLFGSILAAYLAAHRLLGPTLLAAGRPWLNTALLVGPFLVLVAAVLAGVGPGALSGLPAVDPALLVAMFVYAGVSLVLAWADAYGGCEVIEIPNRLFGRAYRTYCIPLVAVDAAERRWGERSPGGPDRRP